MDSMDGEARVFTCERCRALCTVYRHDHEVFLTQIGWQVTATGVLCSACAEGGDPTLSAPIKSSRR